MNKIQRFINNWNKKEVVSNRNLAQETLKEMPEDLLRIEAFNRSGGNNKSISANIKSNGVNFVPQSVKDWKLAVALATDPERPTLLSLDELYQNLMLDAHAMSVIETRVMRVARSKWDLVDANGNANPDLNKLLNRPWFEQFVAAAVMSKFTGIKVLELFNTNEEGELTEITDIPMAHILPNRQEITKEPGDESGTSYVKGVIANYYVQIGKSGDLGILSDLATLILAKKQAMGAWLDYLYKYGVPPIIINTDNYDVTRQQDLLDMGMAMHSNHVMVLQGSENFTIGQVPASTSIAVFKEFLQVLNSEISKRVLGQDGTPENKEGAGTYGSLKVMQELSNDRHESDKLFVQYIINSELLPRLPKINSFYASLANHEFDWDESDELDQKSYVESAVSLTQAGYELDLEELSLRSGISVKGFNAPFSNGAPQTPDTKKKS